MCLQNHQIKFCTCDIDEENLPENYWILCRYAEDIELMIVGEAILPNYDLLSDFDYLNNQNLILERLKESDAFDFKTDFQEQDVLEVYLKNKERSEKDSFCFEFQDKIWSATESAYYYFGLNHLEYKTGKVELNPINYTD